MGGMLEKENEEVCEDRSKTTVAQEEVESRTDLGQYKNKQRELDRADYLKGFGRGMKLERRSRDGVSGGIIG